MRTIFAVFLFASNLPAAEDSRLSVKSEKLDPPAALAKPIRERLAPEAFVIRDDKDVTIRLWFVSEVPARANADQVKNGLTYREIPPTTVLGVVEFPKTFVDFRKQEIPAGTYTLRFALQPETADHVGVTPHREFLLLTDVENDTNAELIEPKVLIERSALINKGDHPAVMMLFPEKDKPTAAKLLNKGSGNYALSFARPVVSDGGKSTLEFTITVAGHVKE